MRNILGHTLLCLVFMLCFTPAFASLQVDNYDKALDKYAVICDRCVGLRAKVEAGESVRTESLKDLLAELSSLRKMLSNASGKMSVAQTERFEAIKAKYLQGMKAFEKRPVGIPEHGRQPMAMLPAISSMPIANAAPSVMEPGEAALRIPNARSCGRLGEANPAKPATLRPANPFKFTVLADAGMFPAPSYGTMAVVTWRGIGAYAGYRSNFRANEYSYTCGSDGDTEYGRIWATGKTRSSRSVATAGVAVLTSKRFGFRAGAGMTSFTRCWEDTSGQWAKVEDKSFRDFALDGGVFLTFRPLIISVGITSDFSGHADANIGLGVRF